MTTTQQNRDRKRRIRAAEGLGLTHVQLWVEPEDLLAIEDIKDHTEQLIDAETKRRHPDGGDT